MASALRVPAQTPAGSKYYITLGDISGAVSQLSAGVFINHSTYGKTQVGEGLISTQGVVLYDLGFTQTFAQNSTISAGVTYHKVLPIGPGFQQYYSTAADVYIPVLNYDGDIATVGDAGALIARL